MTYYERHKDELKNLTWKQAFFKLAEEVLDEHFRDAYDLLRNYLDLKGYRVIGEIIEKKERECVEA